MNFFPLKLSCNKDNVQAVLESMWQNWLKCPNQFYREQLVSNMPIKIMTSLLYMLAILYLIKYHPSFAISWIFISFLYKDIGRCFETLHQGALEEHQTKKPHQQVPNPNNVNNPPSKNCELWLQWFDRRKGKVYFYCSI